LYVDVLWLVTCVYLDSFWAAVSAFLCLACSSSAEHCDCFIKCFFEQINIQTNKQTFIRSMAGNILSNWPFIAAKQAAKLASKMHTPEPLLNDCSSIQVSKLLFAVLRRPSYLLMSSVVGWNDHNVRSRGTLHVVPELPRNSRLSKTPSCPVRIGFVSVRLNRHRFDSINAFNVQRSLSVGLRPRSWFSVCQY